ncbi:efflux RND transporter permease subunit [Pelagibacteraceae bacterium]|nr:efflux RND transporter permease subunit [Pelagibacteraceae bacterium]
MIEFLVDRKRTALAILVVLIFAGIFGRANIPIESEPEIVVPVIYIGVGLTGISPQDAERLLLKPLEDEVRGIEGVDKLQGFAYENYAAVIVQFDAADSMKLSIDKVRDAVNDAKVNFPEDAKDPTVSEVSVTDEPNIIISIDSEFASERYVLNLARQIKKDLELIPSIFEVEIEGARDEQLEAVINRDQLENYNITFPEIIRAVSNNNQVVTTGEISTGNGQFSVSVPGLFESAKDVYELPIRSTDNSSIFLADIAEIKRNFKERKGYTKVNGAKSISLMVKKGRGTNLIETINEVENIVNGYIDKVPSEVNISYILDSREMITDQVNSLQGNILLATLFVLLITMLALGIRSSFIVGSGIPISILVSLFILYIAGYDYNFMVIFGILVALGMLIDGSLVVVEFADRKMVEGLNRTEAYIYAAKRMFWPIVASAATTLAVFIPLFFWPGVSGQFMKVLPLTIFIVLFVALFYSLLFVPVIGSVFGKASNSSSSNFKTLGSDSDFNLDSLSGALGKYVNTLNVLIKRPILTLAIIISALYIVISSYLTYGPGMVFFTTSDPFFGQAKVAARGNLSIDEIEKLSADVEKIITETNGIRSVFLQTGAFGGIGSGGGRSEDTIANLFFEFTERSSRENGHVIISQIRDKVDKISGIKVEVAELQNGPPVGKDLEIRIMGPSTNDLIPIVEKMRSHIDNNVDGLISVEDTLPIPLVEWELIIDKPKASQFGADVFTIGSAVNLVTNGVMIGKYRPNDVDDELEIFVRYPEDQRSIDQLDNIMIETNFGSVPISNFVEKKAKRNVSFIRRYDARNAMYIKANVDETTTVGEKSSELATWVEKQNFPGNIDIVFGGENEEQNNSMKFVIQAFIISILIMAALLVTQFNSFYQSFIILSAVLMSTAGVFFGLLIFDQQFSAIMHGIGIISLAGIVVNNNIILIDAFNFIQKKNKDLDVATSILKASAQRLRPIFLTTITTMLGLIPLALNYSIDPISREIAYDSNVTSFWGPLAQCIVYGLSFSAILTLIVTPCLIVLPSHLRKIMNKYLRPDSKVVNA